MFKNWNPLTSYQYMNIIGIYCIDVDDSKIQRVWFENLTSPSTQSYCILLTTDSQSNIIAYNSFIAGFMPVYDACNNTYSAYLYFIPLKCFAYVGNYWGDHCVDGNSDRHYFLSEAKNIYGPGCNKDYYPIHYFAMDFDNDRLLNYDELSANTDPSLSDTDGDGDTDYQEFIVLKTDPLNKNSNSTSLSINYNSSNSNGTTIIVVNYPYNETSSQNDNQNSTSNPSTTEPNFIETNLFQTIIIAAAILIAGILFGRKTPIIVHNEIGSQGTNLTKRDEISKKDSPKIDPELKKAPSPKK